MISRDCVIQQFGSLTETDVHQFKQILSDHGCKIESNDSHMFIEVLDGLNFDILLIKNDKNVVDVTFVFNGFQFFMTFKSTDCFSLEFISKYKEPLKKYWNTVIQAPDSIIAKSSIKVAEYIRDLMFKENDGFANLLQFWKNLDKPDLCLIEVTVIGGKDSPEDMDIAFSTVPYSKGYKIGILSAFIKKNLSEQKDSLEDILKVFRSNQPIVESLDFERVPNWKLASKFENEKEAKQIWQDDKEFFVQLYNSSEFAPVDDKKFKNQPKCDIFFLSPCSFVLNKVKIPFEFIQAPESYSNLIPSVTTSETYNQFKINIYQVLDPFDNHSLIGYIYTSNEIDSKRYEEKINEFDEIVNKKAVENE